MARKPAKPKKKAPSRAAPRRAWPVQEARAQLSALIDAALTGKPQRITRNGKAAVVVVREDDFAAPKPQDMKSFLAAFQNSPLSELMEAGAIDFEAMRRESPVGPAIDLPDDPEDRA